LLNLGSTLFNTDITRCFGDLAQGVEIRVIRDEPSLLRGTYRVILLRRILNTEANA
jgi:phosphatidylethanolamine/phosphatidyl-N-methylethanolamine N-methyltransferase